MALSFPSNPTPGQTTIIGGTTWQWDGERWSIVLGLGYTGSIGYTGSSGSTGYIGSVGFVGSQGANSIYSIGNTAPLSPTAGDRWFHTGYGVELVYTVDIDSSQWVEIAGSGFAGAPGPAGTQGTVGFTGSAGIGSRSTTSNTTSSLAAGASANLDIVGFKGYNLYKITTSNAAWVAIYTSSATRTADLGRSIGTDPASDSGVITEIITTSGQSVVMSPAVLGFNDESPATTNIPCRVYNNGASTTTITVTLTLVQTES